MRSILRSSFLWQFAGGFVLGALGFVALQPASAQTAPGRPLSPVAALVR
jgi:hypothetical protein